MSLLYTRWTLSEPTSRDAPNLNPVSVPGRWCSATYPFIWKSCVQEFSRNTGGMWRSAASCIKHITCSRISCNVSFKSHVTKLTYDSPVSLSRRRKGPIRLPREIRIAKENSRCNSKTKPNRTYVCVNFSYSINVQELLLEYFLFIPELYSYNETRVPRLTFPFRSLFFHFSRSLQDAYLKMISLS